jgi:pilus assembly protein CpaB
MRTGLVISLIASTVLGAGALLVARVWMPGHSAHAAVTAGPAMATVPVVTAAIPIPYGAKLEAKYLTVSNFPANAAPPGAYSSISQILYEPGGAPIALTPMSVREPLLPAKLSGPGGRFSLAQVIGPGMRAYTIGVNETSGGGGHVMPGDRVDVVLTRDLAAAPGPDSINGRRMVSTVVGEDLRVLGMDLNSNPSSDQPAVARTATLEVTAQDAVKLALAGQAGTLSLALRRIGADQPEPVKPMLIRDLGTFDLPASPVTGHRPTHTPGAPVTASSAPRHPAEPPPGNSVTVVLGSERTSTPVPSEHFGLGTL